MKTLRFKLYSPDNIPNQKEAENISSIFLNNYPEMYPKIIREYDIKRYNSYKKIQEQVKDSNFFIVVIIDSEIKGIIKFRLERRNNFPDHKEWLLSWLIIDKSYRGQGIGEKLLQKSLEEIQTMNKSNESVFIFGDVYKDNIVSINFLNKNNFSKQEGKSSEFFLFYKEIKKR